MSTTDLCDLLGDKAPFLTPGLLGFGGRSRFSGEVVTLKCLEDSARIRETLARPGKGKVLVVDAGASDRCAVFGDRSAQLALDNAWEGIVINGYLRDVQRLSEMYLGIRALGVVPRGSKRRGEGVEGLHLDIAGTTCRPGDRLYADEDGIVLISSEDANALGIRAPFST